MAPDMGFTTERLNGTGLVWQHVSQVAALAHFYNPLLDGPLARARTVRVRMPLSVETPLAV